MSELSVSPRKPLPTDFSRAVGERIQAARNERGMSQKVLAQRIERRQAAVSELERGIMQPDATTLAALAEVLDKPLSYFIPEPWGPRVSRGELTYDEQALLLEFRRLRSQASRQLVIALLATVADTEEVAG
jgi:transcriptional regulator with XRE-family HTH domain